MRHIKSSEAKAKFAELLDAVERGETVVITRHGKEIARLAPSQNEKDKQGRQAMREIIEAQKTAPRVTVREILEWRDEGRRY